MIFRQYMLKKFKYSAPYVMLCCFFLLTACEKKEETAFIEKSDTTEAPTQDELSKKLLQRGVYSDLTLSVTEISNTEQMHLLRDLLEGLVILDPKGNVIPASAEQWYTTDNKSWIFILRPEIKWSNGELLSAHDFVRSWQLLALSDNPIKQYLAFLNLENAEAVLSENLPVERLGITALDDRTLQIRLDKPTPYLPKMLVHTALLPQYTPMQQVSHKIEFISNGAYRLQEQQENLYILEKNPFYRNHAEVTFEQVNYQKIKPQQISDNLDLVEQPQFQHENILYFPQLCSYFYEFNFNDPLLKQRDIRAALTAMISAPDVIGDNKSMLPNSVNFLPQNMQFEQTGEWQPTLVEQLLQQSGISEKNPLILRIVYDNKTVHSAIADRLIRAWSQSDLIQVKAEPVSYKQLMEKREQGDFQLVRSGWCADYNDPSAFLMLLYSKSPDNRMAFNNEMIDKLLEQTLSADISELERTALYQQIILLIQQEKVVLPISQYMKPVYIRDSVAGYDIKNPTEVIYSKDLYRQSESVKEVDTVQ